MVTRRRVVLTLGAERAFRRVVAICWRAPFIRASLMVASLVLAGQAVARPPATPAGKHVSLDAQNVLESTRRSVLQVQTLPLGSDSPYSYGSGFAVGSDGLIVTNYHVVSSVVLDPDRYRLAFLRGDGSKGSLSVVAIDPIHDLAIVRGDTGPMTSLVFDERVPGKGERGFSIGFPRKQGLTVTEGIVNGLSEDSVRGAIHFTGPVNAGMSGGPALTDAGRVFGVNVANLRGSQLISFVVPASAAVALVERARKVSAPSEKDIFADLVRQLKENSKEIFNIWPTGSEPTQQFGGFRALGNPGSFAHCSAQDDKEADKLYRVTEYSCRFKDWTYVADDLYAGNWAFRHRHVRAPDLGALRFASLIEALQNSAGSTSSSKLHKTPWQCQDRIVALSGARARAALCVRRYVRFEGLYDIGFKLVSLDGSAEALLSTFDLTGFGYEEAMVLVRRFMESTAWQP